MKCSSVLFGLEEMLEEEIVEKACIKVERDR
jgi:hypothetical protein